MTSFRNSVIIFFYLIQGLAPQAKMTNKTIETKAPTEKHIVSFSIPPITPCNNRNDPADITALIFFISTTPFALLIIYYHNLHRLSIGQIQNPAVFLAGFCKEKNGVDKMTVILYSKGLDSVKSGHDRRVLFWCNRRQNFKMFFKNFVHRSGILPAHCVIKWPNPSWGCLV